MTPGLAVKSLGQLVYQGVVAALVLVALGMFAWGQIQTARSGKWKERAEDATAAASTAQANATSADTGAANATATRHAIDGGTLTLRFETEQSAGRIESYANRAAAPVADRAPVDPRILRELEDAERQARAAADRLQRAHAR